MFFSLPPGPNQVQSNNDVKQSNTKQSNQIQQQKRMKEFTNY